MKGTGLLLDQDNTITVQNGSVVIGDSTNQEINFLVAMNKGELKTRPLVGAEIKKLIKARVTDTRIKRDINEQLVNDGFRVINTKINLPEIDIDAIRHKK